MVNLPDRPREPTLQNGPVPGGGCETHGGCHGYCARNLGLPPVVQELDDVQRVIPVALPLTSPLSLLLSEKMDEAQHGVPQSRASSGNQGQESNTLVPVALIVGPTLV